MGQKHFRLEVELQALENELTNRLRFEIAEVIAGRKTLYFFNAEHNPFDLPSHMLSSSSDELLRLAHKSVELRQQLMIPTERCVAKYFIAACNENADMENEQRLGPKRLAMRLLTEIEELSAPSS